jgi:hypothetical protein
MTKFSPGRVGDSGRPLRCDWDVTENMRCETVTGKHRAFPLALSWSRTDPFAVTVTFPYTRGPVQWVVALSLLTEGVIVAAGEGDIEVRPLGTDVVIIAMRSPTGVAVLALPRASVERFLSMVDEQVPPDVDTMIDVELRGILTHNDDGDLA